jgi:hypothetical protein
MPRIRWRDDTYTQDPVSRRKSVFEAGVEELEYLSRGRRSGNGRQINLEIDLVLRDTEFFPDALSMNAY